MKKIIAVILAIACFVSVAVVAGCAKKSNIKNNGTETNADGTLKEVNNETKFNFLVMGYDRQAMLADVMMLVSFDTEEKDMAIMQIPRDTYIEVEENSYHKINGIFNYFLGEAREEDSDSPELDGCNKTAEYLEKALGVPIHYSAVMDLEGFGEIVDAIGGVNFYVPYPMHYEDPKQNLYIHLDQQRYNLTGDQAEQFVRYRSGYINADLGRGDAQKMFMTAFIESVKANISVSNVAGIATSVVSNVRTDMSTSDIISFGTAFLGLELDKTTMFTAPGEVASSYYVLNKECLKDVLNEHFNIYVEKLTEDEIDRDGLFCNEENSSIKAVYEKAADELDFETHNAQDVSKEDIYVPLK